MNLIAELEIKFLDKKIDILMTNLIQFKSPFSQHMSRSKGYS